MSGQNCSPLNVLFSYLLIILILQSVPLLGSVKQGWDGNKLLWS